MNKLPNKIRLLAYTGDKNESLVYDEEKYIDIPKDSVIIVLTKTPTEYSIESQENAKQDKDHLKYAFIYVDPNNNILNYGRKPIKKLSMVKNPMISNVDTPVIETSELEHKFELFNVTADNKYSDSFYHIKRLDTKELKNTNDSKIFENDILDFLNKTKIDIQFTQTGWFKGGNHNISNKTRKIPTKKMVHNRTIKNLVNYGIEKE
jgi:hypothetical protein